MALTLGESRRARAIEALAKLAREHGGERWMAAAIVSSSRDTAGRLLLGLLRDGDTSGLAPASLALLDPLATTLGGRRAGRDIADVLAAIAALDEASRLGLHGDRPPSPIPPSTSPTPSSARRLTTSSTRTRGTTGRFERLSCQVAADAVGKLRVAFGRTA